MRTKFIIFTIALVSVLSIYSSVKAGSSFSWSRVEEKVASRMSDVSLGANNGFQGDGTINVLGTGTSTLSFGSQFATRGGNIAIGGTATTTLRGDNATSTFSNGITLSGGCFRDATGACMISSAGSGANTALSNLASVAINTSLISDTNNTDDLGSAAISWKDVFASGTVISGSGTSSFYNLSVSNRASTSYLGISNYLDMSAMSNPAAPPAGVSRLHAATLNGFTRFEQDNEATTNVVFGRDSVFIGRNTSGADITTGMPVYVTGSTGNVPNVSPARSNTTSTLPAVGVALDPISNNNSGQIMKLGIITGIDTSDFTTGDQLYVSPFTAGSTTNIRPSHPMPAQRIGSVLVSGKGNGSMLVTIAPFIGQVDSGSRLQNFTVGDGKSTSTIASNATSTFQNGAVFATSGGNVGIGQSSPTVKLDVNGNIKTGAGSSLIASVGLNDDNTGIYSAGTNILGLLAGGSTINWDSSTFYPSTSNSKDLGKGGNVWKNLSLGGIVYASGTLLIGTTGTAATSTVQHNLNVQGNIVLNDRNLSSTSTFYFPTSYVPATSTGYFEIPVGVNCLAMEAVISATSTIAGAPTVIDVNIVNSTRTATTTLFGTNFQPQLNGGSLSSTTPVTGFSNTAGVMIPKGSYLSADVDQLGGHKGLNVQIMCAKPLW